ncbi:MAG: aldehyde dehydrogenase family protein [Syntrophorhabdus sp.]|nr:aldehyde dehydrogenase family protein [Syntrophorhabdus sp.]MDI9557283.1 aldehyde dehydrogenase family protein [Pseudomonadota bacterium]HNS77686.1 aldehyde dehydrogenase family protein [Syntrophorhabdus sp.]HNY69227.1 aldehyde dehydrogenase family protein [Syntrophorhabdus sp.]HQG24713.1 aldehyde dehydrogenase family protein [Syntrophorhabdus sp.]
MAILPEVKKHYGRLKFFINGEWIESKSNNCFENTNPATGDVIAEVPVATEAEVEAAINSAWNAFKKWSNIPFRDRADYINRLRAKFDEHHEELSRILSQDHGRGIDDARGTIDRCIENIESASGAMYSLYKGEHVEQLATGIDCYLMWEPVGVFLILTPGNIPMHAWSSFVPYALACGCPVIVAPSWQCPVASEAMFKIADEVGFPPGVLNLLHVGTNFELNSRIISDSRVAGVGFIGSTAVGRELFELCGRLGKRSSINGNGKNHIVVAPDGNLDAAANYLLRGCFGMTGQRCLGSDNVAVIGNIYDDLKDKFLQAAKAMKVGFGLDETSEMGPLTTLSNKKKVENFIEKGLNEGAKLILDGRELKVKGYENGYFLGPSIFEGVSPSMEIAKEESFGPVSNLIRADSLEQVIEWINTNTEFGHSACLITESGKNARKFIRECNVGNVGINAGIPQPYAFFPLGSKRQSFFGVAKSRMDSVRMFLDQKTVTLRWV